MRILTILLIPWLVFIFSHAQGEENNEYKVEMILFSHQNSQAAGADRKQEGNTGASLENTAELSWDPALSNYVILSEFDKDLNPVVATLNRSSRYQVIMHLVWRQAMHTRELAKPLHIHGGTDFSGQFPAGVNAVTAPRIDIVTDQPKQPLPLEQVDGTVTLFVGRYLHVLTDLIYRQPAMPRERNSKDEQISESNVLVDYTVRNSRKMRSTELHYLDHPLLGILVQITPIENNSQP